MSKKWELKFETFYDKEGMEEHFKEMAKKGWMIEKITSFSYYFKRIEPKNLHFAISYYPFVGEFGEEVSPDIDTFKEFLEHDGWHHVADGGWLSVYCHEGESPKEIETDEKIKISNIQAAYKKFFLLRSIGLMFLVLWYLFGNIVSLQTEFTNYLSSFGLFTFFMWVGVGISHGIQTFAYFLWVKRAKAQAELGESYRFKRPKLVNKLALGISTFPLFLFIANGLFFGNAREQKVALSLFLLLPIFILIRKLMGFFRNQGIKKGAEIGLYLLLSYFVLSGFSYWITTGSYQAGGYYNSLNGEKLFTSTDVHGNKDFLYRYIEHKKSIFLEQILFYGEGFEYEFDRNYPPFFHEKIRRELLKDGNLEKVSPEEYGAKEAYKKDDDTILVLIYEKQMVKFNRLRKDYYQRMIEDGEVKEKIKKYFGA